MNFFQYILQLLGLYRPTTTTTTTPHITIPDNPNGGNKLKIALCTGINKYPNPANNLAGCVNDAQDNVVLLKEYFKFDEVVLLLDSYANYNNVTSKMRELLAKKPAVFVYTNSSHGTRMVDASEPDGYAEAICLYDRLLIDKDFRSILATADPSTRITVVSDSCHSAGVTREFLLTMNDFTYASQPKYLPPEGNMEAMAVGMLPISKAIFEPNENMNEVLLAGCKSDQYSYDASFNSRPNGAFTYYMNQVLRATPEITYGDFIRKINQALPSSRYPQCPVLETNSQMEKTLIFS